MTRRIGRPFEKSLGLVRYGDADYEIICFEDENRQLTDDPAEANWLLLQKPEWRRPEGQEQRYRLQWIEKGSLKVLS